MTSLVQLSRPLAKQIASSSRIPLSAHFASSSSRSAPKLAANKLQGVKKQVVSSCPPGTVFNGIGILKDGSDPVAKADEEYPEWLWSMIEENEHKVSELEKTAKQIPKKREVMDFAVEKRRLHAVRQAAIKASNFLKTS